MKETINIDGVEYARKSPPDLNVVVDEIDYDLSTKKEVKAAIYCLSGRILMGKATKSEIEKVTIAAEEFGLLDIVKQEFGSISKTLKV